MRFLLLLLLPLSQTSIAQVMEVLVVDRGAVLRSTDSGEEYERYGGIYGQTYAPLYGQVLKIKTSDFQQASNAENIETIDGHLVLKKYVLSINDFVISKESKYISKCIGMQAGDWYMTIQPLENGLFKIEESFSEESDMGTLFINDNGSVIAIKSENGRIIFSSAINDGKILALEESDEKYRVYNEEFYFEC